MIEIQTRDGYVYKASCGCGWRGSETWFGAAELEEQAHEEECA